MGEETLSMNDFKNALKKDVLDAINDVFYYTEEALDKSGVLDWDSLKQIGYNILRSIDFEGILHDQLIDLIDQYGD